MMNNQVNRIITDLSGQLLFGIECDKEVIVLKGFKQTLVRMYKEEITVLGTHYEELLNYISLSERALLNSTSRAKLKFFNLHGLRNSINGCRKSAFKMALEYRHSDSGEVDYFNVTRNTILGKLNKVQRELAKFPSLKQMCDEMLADVILDIKYAGGDSNLMSARMNYYCSYAIYSRRVMTNKILTVKC